MSENDILTTQKNHVVATNSLNQTWLDLLRAEHGAETSPCVTAPTVVAIGPGHFVKLSVVVGGDGGFVYDAASTDGLQDSARLMALPKEIGVYDACFRFTNGLVVSPSGSKAATVTYSLD